MAHQVEELKLKLKYLTKDRLNMERQLLVLRNSDRSLNEQIMLFNAEIIFMQEQLEDMQKDLSQAHHQIDMIEICTKSEQTKLDEHILILQAHKESFEMYHSRERDREQQHTRDMEERSAQKLQLELQVKSLQEKENDQRLREAAAAEAECDALERECAVLKKRNAAIMLKLRRQLVNAEKSRRNLINQDGN